MNATKSFEPDPLVVHQLLPNLRRGDAAGSHSLKVREALREAGYVSEIFVEMHDEGFGGDVHHYSDLSHFCDEGRTALIYQLAIGSKVADAIAARTEPLIVNYHNLTPPSYFGTWDPGLVDGIVWGLRQLHHLVPRTVHAIAVSSFNERDLLLAGYPSTAVVPPFVDIANHPISSNGTLRRRRDDSAGIGAAETPADGAAETPAAGAAETSGARWLFVGRLAPNKAAHDIVMALAAYRHVYDPQARLTLVGGLGHDLYTKAVRALVEALDLTGAVEITGPVSDAELASAYEHADVFVCLSDHEGFCFPILEAMSNDLPVIAHSAGAVPDTVGSGGVVLESKSPPAVAAAIHGVLAQPGRRERLIEAGRSRLRNFEPAKTKALFLSEVRRGLARAGLVRNGPVVARGMAESHGEPS